MQLLSKYTKGLLWFALESLQIVAIFTGFFIMLWLYGPMGFLWKVGITFVSIGILYDVFRHFVYLKFVLWKEAQGLRSVDKFDLKKVE
jgi:hypothetical protein